MKKFSNKIFHPIIMLWLAIPNSLYGSTLCDEDYLEQNSRCEYLSDENGLPNQACLQKFHACGKFKEIINHFGSDPLVSTSDTARYYKGISYYGLSQRTQAQSLFCQYRTVAMQELSGYLAKGRNFRNVVEFKQTYHASKILEELLNKKGCLEQGLNENQIDLTTREYSDNVLKSLFIGDLEEGALRDNVNEVKKEIHSVINGIVSTASNTETQIGMRKVSLYASRGRIMAISNIFENQFGEVDRSGVDTNGLEAYKFTLTESSRLNSLVKKTDGYLALVQEIKKELNEAMNNMNINDYEDARGRIIERAKILENNSNDYQNLVKDLNTDNYKEMVNHSSEEGASTVAENNINQVFELWRARPGSELNCRFTSPKPWYCERGIE